MKRTNYHLFLGPRAHSSKAASVRFEDDENDDDSDNVDRSQDQKSAVDYSVAKGTSASVGGATQQSNGPTQKLFAHQFYNVYADMTDDEWTKVRNAFVTQLFSE